MAVIIYVDDDLDAWSYMRNLLDNAFEFIGFAGPNDALKFLETRGGDVDAIITDSHMSIINVRQLLQTVTKQWPNVARILSVSQSNLEAICEHVNERHVDCVIQRPSKSDDVAFLISECVTYKKLHGKPIELQTIENNLHLSLMRAEFAAAALQQSYPIENKHLGLSSGLAENSYMTANVLVEEIAGLRQAIDEVSRAISINRRKLTTQTLDLGVCIEDTLKNLASKSHDVSKVTLKYEDNLSIIADSELLTAALSQVFANAFCALSNIENPFIDISAIRSGRDVVVQIRDNGIWNDVGVLSTVLKDAEAMKSGEPSIGFNIAIWIIRENGGTLQFLPRKPNGMTTVITIPLILQ